MQKSQISESIKVGVLLALAGGFMDAYSYIGRGGVFANAETGNIVLLAINLMNMNFLNALHYLIPISAFASGVFIAEYLRHKKNAVVSSIHWRQITIFIELIIMVIIAFMPQKMNLLVNSLISLTCGIQVDAFSKIKGYAIATTMCTGNLRNGTQNMSEYFSSHNKENLKAAMFYYGCIICFIVGAMIGGLCTHHLGEKASIVVSVILVGVFFLMFFNKTDE